MAIVMETDEKEASDAPIKLLSERSVSLRVSNEEGKSRSSIHHGIRAMGSAE